MRRSSLTLTCLLALYLATSYLHLITTMININATTKVPCEVFMVLIFLSIGFVATTTSLIFVIRVRPFTFGHEDEGYLDSSRAHSISAARRLLSGARTVISSPS